MAMTEPGSGDPSGLAAEYVLGTLDAEEKAEAEALLRSSGAFAAEVEAWRRRLDPLLEAAPATPPAGVFEEVLAAIGAREDGAPAAIVQLRRRAAIWKWTAAAATALAASLLVVIASRIPGPPATPSFVAVLESADKKPAFVATAGPARGGLFIERLGPPPPPGRSFELDLQNRL